MVATSPSRLMRKRLCNFSISPPNDLPNAMMTRWLAYIRLFDFHVKHIPGNKNGDADALSRHDQAPQDPLEDENEADDYFDAKLYSIQASDQSSDWNPILSRQEFICTKLNTTTMISFLDTILRLLQRPEDMTDQQFQQLRKKSRTFFVHDDYLFKRSRRRENPSSQE